MFSHTYVGMSTKSFNPHPAALPGEWQQHRESRATRKVSIRTRQRCRVNGAGDAGWSSIAGFNPHPAALPGEWRNTSASGPAKSFQSAPGSAAG